METSSGVMAEMPKFKSHKTVWALKISRISLDTKTAKKLVHFEDTRYAPIELPDEYYEKHKPQSGGYYVIYEDGYKSWSPADAFESGYKPFTFEAKSNEEKNFYNPTCAVSGERSDLQMFPIRNERDEMIGWIFLNENIKREAYDFSLNRELKPTASPSPEIPRRNLIGELFPQEKAIYEAIQEVEKMPADTRLTDAVILLAKAKEKIADFIDSEEGKLWRMKNAKPV